MVTIVDRTGEQKEIKWDQRIWSFGKKTTLVLPLDVATSLFNSINTTHFVHTTAGEFVRRYGVVDAPEDWVAEVGMDVLETSPLTRDASRLEGWDASQAGAKTDVIDLKQTPNRPQRGDYANQGDLARAGS